MMGNGSMTRSSEMATDTNPGKIEWENTVGMMNAMSDAEMVEWKLVDQATVKENMDIDWQFKKRRQSENKNFQRSKVPTPNAASDSRSWTEVLSPFNKRRDYARFSLERYIESGMMLEFKVS